MRAIAAALVVICHALYPATMGNQNPAKPYSDWAVTEKMMWFFNPGGPIALSFFFILSGFIITWSARPGERVTAYWRRRVVKIMPNHAVTWALAMILFAGVYTPYWGLPNLFLINAFSPNVALWGGANMPAWSLGPEMFFYLLFPLLIIPVRKISESRLWLWLGVMVVGMAALCLVTITFISDVPMFPGESQSLPQFWFSYMFPPVRLVEFVFGMIVARIVISGRWPRIPNTPVVLLFLIAYAAILYIPEPFNQTLVTAIPFGLLLGTYATANLRGVRTVMGAKPMVWLGNISFAFYLTQSFVLFWLRPKVLGNAEYGVVGGTLLIIGEILVNIVFGWILFKLVEMPAMRHWSRARKPVTRPAGAQPESTPAG
ncbi:acyltransferase family protein [Planotetraspora sp. GP83]|uniref:acyltransferase family protein n=1 Tax=Planotetraspora sp. GP83 TaxID=3156264 RepID=UPI003518229B